MLDPLQPRLQLLFLGLKARQPLLNLHRARLKRCLRAAPSAHVINTLSKFILPDVEVRFKIALRKPTCVVCSSSSSRLSLLCIENALFCICVTTWSTARSFSDFW